MLRLIIITTFITINMISCEYSKVGTTPSGYPNFIQQKDSLQEKKTSSGSLFTGDDNPYSDVKAHKPGDILTVIIQEQNAMLDDGKVDLSKESEVSTSVDATKLDKIAKYLSIIGQQMTDLTGTRKSTHAGKAKYERKTTVSDKIAVIITEKRRDGLLTVYGRRQIVLDGETKMVGLTGLVNPDDIMADNSIYSDHIALSSIYIQGKGTLTSYTEPGFGSKTFNWVLDLLWPF